MLFEKVRGSNGKKDVKPYPSTSPSGQQADFTKLTPEIMVFIMAHPRNWYLPETRSFWPGEIVPTWWLIPLSKWVITPVIDMG